MNTYGRKTAADAKIIEAALRFVVLTGDNLEEEEYKELQRAVQTYFTIRDRNAASGMRMK